RWKPGAGNWKHLVAAARVADPDEWRNRLRDVVETKELGELEKIVASAPVADWPPSTLGLLDQLTPPTPLAERVAGCPRGAQQRQREDFWLNHEIARHQHEAYRIDARPQRLEEANRFFTAAVILRPQSPGAHNNLGTALSDRGFLDAAMAEFRVALHLAEDYPLAQFNLGNVLLQKGLLDEALAECREAVRLDKDDAEAQCQLGFALEKKGLPDAAIPKYREAIRLDKDLYLAHHNL